MARQCDSGGRVRVAAIALDKRGRIIYSSVNNYSKTHPAAKRIASKYGVPERDRLHAELRTLLACRGQVVASLVVARVDKKGNVCDGMPCVLCREAIKWVESLQGSSINIIYSKSGENNGY